MAVTGFHEAGANYQKNLAGESLTFRKDDATNVSVTGQIARGREGLHNEGDHGENEALTLTVHFEKSLFDAAVSRAPTTNDGLYYASYYWRASSIKALGAYYAVDFSATRRKRLGGEES